MWDELVKSPGKSTSSIKVEGMTVYGSGNNGFWEVEARTNTCKCRKRAIADRVSIAKMCYRL